jgi:hypothetical protein
MVINDGYIMGIIVFPSKNYPPLIVDPDTPESLVIA